jgi:hypothetical protein
MFQVFVDTAGQDIKVFRDQETARRWVGLA